MKFPKSRTLFILGSVLLLASISGFGYALVSASNDSYDHSAEMIRLAEESLAQGVEADSTSLRRPASIAAMGAVQGIVVSGFLFAGAILRRSIEREQSKEQV